MWHILNVTVIEKCFDTATEIGSGNSIVTSCDANTETGSDTNIETGSGTIN